MGLFAPFRPIVQDPTLALSAVLLVLFSTHLASVLPYASSLAVTVFGLGDGSFSAVLVVASLIAVTSSVGFGILADQRANRRGIALLSATSLTLGTALMVVAPGPVTFVLVHVLLLPLASSIFGQIFALARLAATLHPAADRPAIQSTLRALFALPWVMVLPVWALVFRSGAALTVIYPVCLVCAAALLGLTWWLWPRDGATRWPDPRSGLSFRQSLREIWDPGVLLRVVSLGAINGGVTLYLVVIGLVFAATPGRGAADTALYAGITAGLEVPFMLALPLVLNRVPQARLILIGAVLYAVHLAGIPLLAGSWTIWVLPWFAAIGGAVVLTQPMAYLQELLAARPGAGASLMALQKLVGDAFCAATFAVGVALSGYGLAAVMGAVFAVTGATALVLLDWRQSR
ncbi:hypothetical protein [Paenirhodobacter sp.]|uniref:hypothetical protein n=1 Tax=Paenirhodobacter sp. TaxID=1965326 RepID=UPI003B3C05E4